MWRLVRAVVKDCEGGADAKSSFGQSGTSRYSSGIIVCRGGGRVGFL